MAWSGPALTGMQYWHFYIIPFGVPWSACTPALITNSQYNFLTSPYYLGDSYGPKTLHYPGGTSHSPVRLFSVGGDRAERIESMLGSRREYKETTVSRPNDIIALQLGAFSSFVLWYIGYVNNNSQLHLRANFNKTYNNCKCWLCIC